MRSGEWKYIRSTGTSAALAIFQKPVFQRSTRLRVPSGASPYQNLSLPRISAAACSTTPWAALRSEERRVGKECVSTCRSRWWQDHSKKNTIHIKPKHLNNKQHKKQ